MVIVPEMIGSVVGVYNASWIEAATENSSRDWWWFMTGHLRINMLWAIVFLEHLLIMIKMGLGAMIEDTPAWVYDAIKREVWERERVEEMREEEEERRKEAATKNLRSEVLDSVGDWRPAVPAGKPPANFMPNGLGGKADAVSAAESAPSGCRARSFDLSVSAIFTF